MSQKEPAPPWRTPATLSATAGGLAMAAVGAMQAVRPFDDDPRVLGEEHLILGLFAASLVLLVPGLFALARHGTGAAVAGAVAVSAGHLLLAFGATASNLRGEDPPWFGHVAAPANLAMLAGAVVTAVSLWRAGRVPRPIAAALPAMWLCEIVLAQVGGGMIAGVYWLLVCHLPAPGAPEEVTVPEYGHG
ncbi:hypothetical protein ACIBCT_28275 [Streptosporangium sp. NPDC050855]|uniref:hypothetical protein n=1 Tax=Streptosporangium sp. NPDC050855 TaxID=3366194 RepID=UPI003799C81D